jgi:conjugative transfer signal peptidase TraF
MLLHRKGRITLITLAVAAGIAVAIRTLYPLVGPPLLINYTDSEPKGLYWLEARPSAHYARGELVAFAVPEPFQGLIYGREWLAKGLPLMKGIGALEGDQVCIDDVHVSINGAIVGPVFAADSAGRALPKIRGCFKVGAGFFLPLSTLISRSFDGRYLGEEPLSEIRGTANPLWIF